MTAQVTGTPEVAKAAPTDDVAPRGAAPSLEGGSYDVIRRRLLEQAAELAAKAEALNERRKKVFGGAELALIANERVRTEHNAVPRDLVSVAGNLVMGFVVFMGLKTETTVKDVFALYEFQRTGETWDLSALPFEGSGAFLADDAFVKEVRDTFKYMKDARLLRLKRTESRLLAVVQIGATINDAKVFRFAIDASARVTYMDARGDEDAKLPRQHDFVWTQTTRENQVPGPHPHLNVLDTVFVETIGGDLTVKIENNTKDGKGVYSEPVDDANQTLDDADVAYAKVGHLVLLRIKPFREDAYRYLVFDSRARRVVRIDAIGEACHELPEDHGIVFPGGYFLQSGDYKVFDGESARMAFERVVKSPNGEDVLYVYHRPEEGEYLLLPYNAIRKEISTPIRCHGYSLFADGTMAVFRAALEPTRVHPLQIWRTPFTSAEHAAAAPRDGSYLAKVGNADLVRGISDAFALRRAAGNERPTRTTYEDLATAVSRAIDAHYWLGHSEAGDLASTLAAMKKTTELVLDEFDKVEAIQRRAREELAAAAATQKDLLTKVRPDDLVVVEDYLRALATLRQQRGKLVGLRDVRGMEVSEVARLEREVAGAFDEVSKACVAYFLHEDAFAPLVARLDEIVKEVESAAKASDLTPFGTSLDVVQEGLTLLAEVVGSLAIDDATARTKILEGVSQAFGHQNRARAIWQGRKRDLGAEEGRAEFAAQFRLFGQSVTGAIALCATPEACDEQLSKLLLALEDLEGRFGDVGEFTTELATKREEVNDAVGARRQQLLDERQRRAQNLFTAAERILSGVGRRAQTFATADELNAYFASDAMVQKLVDVRGELQKIGDVVRAEEVASRVKAAKQDALRALRDKLDLGGEEGAIKLGEHSFTVHTQPLDLVLVPRDGAMTLHLTGTDYFEPIVDPALEAAKDLWDRSLVSESDDVYRGEFLAASILLNAEDGKIPSLDTLTQAARTNGLVDLVRAWAQDRLDEGYERGIHDADAAIVLDKLLALHASAGLLRFLPDARALALLHFGELSPDARTTVHMHARSVGRLKKETSQAAAQAELARSLEGDLEKTARAFGWPVAQGVIDGAARYLVLELAEERLRFVASAQADALCRGLFTTLDEHGSRRAFQDEIATLSPEKRFAVALAYVEAFLETKKLAHARSFAREAATMLLTSGADAPTREVSAATAETQADGLLGAHRRIANRSMRVAIDELLGRLEPFIEGDAARFRAFRRTKTEILEREKKRLRLSEFLPRVLTSFVRNGLIDKVYLPLVGANLAKQIGAAGAKKRTDLMGMLLLVSPPGYGKTTLMEYVASKLGLVFVKVNGPALGHDVTSLDPAEARSGTARQEVEKINLAFEMGQNVMLYLDDIQHTNSELLQKFISLCDGQRRVEGMWKGESRTYDLRGKKFCIVMAGNPYTESGARFQIPDMLANRADTYNLGDILGGQERLFSASYVENALTSNASLAPLATRDNADIERFVKMARGEEDIALTNLKHGYSAAEAEEVVRVFQHLLKVQAVLLRVNQEYIRSASQEDAYRTEPAFKLQGSYRNMNKLAEKIVAAMNDDELERLLDDHYASESQTLTTGAEQNLLKLAEIRGRMTDVQRARWKDIKESYVRTNRAGGKGDDPVARVTGALGGVDAQLQKIGSAIQAAQQLAETAAAQRAAAPAVATKVAVTFDDGTRSAALAAIVRDHARTMERVLAALGELTKPMAHIAAASVAPQPAFGGSFAPGGSIAPGTSPPPSVAAVEQRLGDLIGLVQDLDRRMSTTAQASPQMMRFEVGLDGGSASNFYRPLEGTDIVTHGGLFVATYAKLPALGARVTLAIEFPGGVRTEIEGVVTFRQDDLGDAAAGFGAKIVRASADACGMIAQFVRHREPLVRE